MPADLDKFVRIFIAERGSGEPGNLSKFIELAVRNYLLGRSVEAAKPVTNSMSEAEIAKLIDEAVRWARRC